MKKRNKEQCTGKVLKHHAKHIEVLFPVGLGLSGISEMTEPNLGLPQWLPSWLCGKECLRMQEIEFDLWIGNVPWKRKWQPTPVFSPGKSHGQRILADYSPWGHKRVGHNLATKQQQQKSPIHHFINVKHLKWK